MPEAKAEDALNPYASPIDAQSEIQLAGIYVAPFSYPPGESECAFLSYPEFALLLEQKLQEACLRFAIPVVREPDATDAGKPITTISGRVLRVTDYQLTRWNHIKKWFIPFLDYQYRAASFEVVGQVESFQHPTIPFRLDRKFARGRLAFQRRRGEKINLLIGLSSEATRVIALAAGRRAQSQRLSSGAQFWSTAIFVPLVAATCGAFLVYSVQQAALDTRWIRTGLTFISIALLSLAALPSWLYRDTRSAFLYRFTAAKGSLQLRAFPLILGLLSAGLVIASFMYGDG